MAPLDFDNKKQTYKYMGYVCVCVSVCVCVFVFYGEIMFISKFTC